MAMLWEKNTEADNQITTYYSTPDMTKMKATHLHIHGQMKCVQRRNLAVGWSFSRSIIRLNISGNHVEIEFNWIVCVIVYRMWKSLFLIKCE